MVRPVLKAFQFDSIGWAPKNIEDWNYSDMKAHGVIGHHGCMPYLCGLCSGFSDHR